MNDSCAAIAAIRRSNANDRKVSCRVQGRMLFNLMPHEVRYIGQRQPVIQLVSPQIEGRMHQLVILGLDIGSEHHGLFNAVGGSALG